MKEIVQIQLDQLSTLQFLLILFHHIKHSIYHDPRIHQSLALLRLACGAHRASRWSCVVKRHDSSKQAQPDVS